jgi:tetratricopeptide (TPR) repeat protein
MKRYEKILLLLLAVIFLLQLLDFTGKVALFRLICWLLGGSYLFAGYWLLRTAEKKHAVLAVLAGIAFAPVVAYLPSLLWLRMEAIKYYLPVANALLFIFLGIYLLVKRKSGEELKHRKLLFARSAVFLLLSGFFSYTPVSFTPYRKIMYALNNGNEYLQANLRMFDYMYLHEEAREAGNCDQSLEYALKENKAGRFWLGLEKDADSEVTKGKAALTRLLGDTAVIIDQVVNSNRVFADEPDLWMICGTYSDIYEGYKCKADRAYNGEHYGDALREFITAHFYLNACEHKFKNWNVEKAWSLNNIAHCYRKMGNYAYADSFFVEAIRKYKAVNTTEDIGLAQLYSNFGYSLTDEMEYNLSVRLFKRSNAILKKDSLNPENRESLVSNYLGITDNYLKMDSLQHALFFAKKAIRYSDRSKGKGTCQPDLFYGVCLLKLNAYSEADSVFKNCRSCYEQEGKEYRQMVAECNLELAIVNIALARYEKAKTYLDEGMEITAQNYGTTSTRFANYLKVKAYLHQLTGDYAQAETEYNTVLNIYRNESGSSDYRIPEVLAGLAEVNISLSELPDAKTNAANAVSLAAANGTLNYPGSSGVNNAAAYVNYCSGLYTPSDTLYKKVISINSSYGLTENAAIAIALNGLGLNATATHNLQQADSLFRKSLAMHQRIFTDIHPHTATVYLNYGNLLIAQGRLQEAEEKINKALQINTPVYKSDHDFFGDVLVAQGDLARKKGQTALARENYTKALAIYQRKFNETHWKIKATRGKL